MTHVTGDKNLDATIYLRTEFLWGCADVVYLVFYGSSLWQMPVYQRHWGSMAGFRREFQVCCTHETASPMPHLKHTEGITSRAFLRNVALKLLDFIPNLCFAFRNQWTVTSFSLLLVAVNRINDLPKTHVDRSLFLSSASFVCLPGNFTRVPIAFVSKNFILLTVLFDLCY